MLQYVIFVLQDGMFKVIASYKNADVVQKQILAGIDFIGFVHTERKRMKKQRR